MFKKSLIFLIKFSTLAIFEPLNKTNLPPVLQKLIIEYAGYHEIKKIDLDWKYLNFVLNINFLPGDRIIFNDAVDTTPKIYDQKNDSLTYLGYSPLINTIIPVIKILSVNNDQVLFLKSNCCELRNITNNQIINKVKFEFLRNAFSGCLLNNNKLAIATFAQIQIYDLETNQKILAINTAESVNKDICPVTDNVVALYLKDNAILQFYNIQIGALIRNVRIIGSISFLNKITDNLVAIGKSSGNISIIDIKKLEFILYFKAHEKAVNFILVNQNKLITGSDDMTVKFWDLDALCCKEIIHCDDKVKTIDISKTGTIAIGKTKSISILKTLDKINLMKNNQKEKLE